MARRYNIDEMREDFLLYDKIGDNKIALKDAGELARALGLNPRNSEIKKIVAERNENTRISFEEFKPIYDTLKKQCEKNAEQFPPEMIKEGFRVFDDQKGRISYVDTRKLLMRLGEALTDEEADEILKGYDDSEGMISYDTLVNEIMGQSSQD